MKLIHLEIIPRHVSVLLSKASNQHLREKIVFKLGQRLATLSDRVILAQTSGLTNQMLFIGLFIFCFAYEELQTRETDSENALLLDIMQF